ncbi:aspartate aminotransferase family protein [Microlunatus sp. Y2014]|uniref:aspartate aminotransferase family protein n=1 Tax=Microlunatus sp. Y2014 TaxID=3418488 RepID=UPI003DA78AC3
MTEQADQTATTMEQWYERARRTVAGGVSSDARRMAGTPLFVDRAHGAELIDLNGKRYVDYVLGQGPDILGHASEIVAEAVSAQVRRGVAYAAQHRDEALVAELLCDMVPSADLVRFNSVGSEAVHGALRLARGHTGRDLVIKFEGHYHGWLDPVLHSVHPPLDAAGAADRPTTVAGTLGLTPGSGDSLRVLGWNDPAAVEAAFAAEGDRIAAVICEPLLCNTGAIEPEPGFLEFLRDICTRNGSVLIFDEIITGFRVGEGGAQQRFGVTPDLTTLGKAMAGGMQVAALAGSAAVMGTIASGRVGHAGTFNSHPVAMAAAKAVLGHLHEHADAIYPGLTTTGQSLMTAIAASAERHGVPLLVAGPGPLFQTYFTDQPVIRTYREYAACDHALAARFHAELLRHGVNIVPRGLWFLSTAHGADHVNETAEMVDAVLASL